MSKREVYFRLVIVDNGKQYLGVSRNRNIYEFECKKVLLTPQILKSHLMISSS